MSKEQSPRNILRRYPLAFACAGVALLLAGYALFRGSAVDEAAAELDAKRGEAQKSERNVLNSAKIEEHLEALKSHVARLESVLIGVDDVSGNQAFFYRLESSTGVRILVLRPTGAARDVPKDAAYVPAGFNVVVQGTYSQVLAFLHALENGERLYRLIDFAVQRSSDNQSAPGVGPQISLNLTLQLLARKP